jgi:hypothetical protein
MRKSLKSALLSALVFPGAGHFYLRKYRMAALLIVTTLVSLSLIVMEAIKQAMSLLEKIEASGAAINADNIVEMSTRAADSANTTTTSIATLLIAVCWFVGIIDAYRSGKQDNIKQSS